MGRRGSPTAHPSSAPFCVFIDALKARNCWNSSQSFGLIAASASAGVVGAFVKAGVPARSAVESPVSVASASRWRVRAS